MSACSRAFSRASRAAAPEARSSSGSSTSEASWTIAAIGSPVVVEAGHRTIAVVCREHELATPAVTYSRRSGSQNPTRERDRPAPARARPACPQEGPLQLEHQLADVRPREPRPQHPGDERDRQAR